jgi:uncharacterized membrane-anchored protein
MAPHFTSFASIVGYMISLMNDIITVLAAAGMVFFMYGVFQYVRHAPDKGGGRRTVIAWSLFALVLMFSIWGVLRFVCYTFLGTACNSNSGGAPLDIRYESLNNPTP